MEKKQVKYFEGIDDVFFVPMLEKDTSMVKPIYDTENICRLPIATKLGVKGNGSEKVKYASSKVFRRVSRETEHELSLDHVGMPIELLDALNGVVPVKGVVFNKAQAREMPYFAFGFIGRIEGGDKMAVWYPRVQLTLATDSEYETATDDDEIKDVSLTMVASSLIYNEVINASFNSMRETPDLITVEEFIEEVIYEEAQLTATEPDPSGQKKMLKGGTD